MSLSHFLEAKHLKICNISINNTESYAKRYFSFCNKKCMSDCNEMHFSKLYPTDSPTPNSTTINLIPLNSHHIQYIETMKTDINQLIYDLGGVVGLWFGLYALSIVNFILFLYKVFNKMHQIIDAINNQPISKYEIVLNLSKTFLEFILIMYLHFKYYIYLFIKLVRNIIQKCIHNLLLIVCTNIV